MQEGERDGAASLLQMSLHFACVEDSEGMVRIRGLVDGSMGECAHHQELVDQHVEAQHRSPQGMATLTMLVSWVLWNERNARVFQKKSTPPFYIPKLILEESKLWVSAGARQLSAIMP